jgi:EAL domain-containing protein (putative c-di-GMP-specific phosphodiesterase class I)
VPIGEWVIRQACATASRWPSHLHVAVNISAVQFRQPGLTEVIVGALAAFGLDPRRLEIEITESILLQDRNGTLTTLHQLRALGIKVAMDDFGTGYSSLTYLQCFPFDEIKIDRSFVSGVENNAASLSIVRAVAALAHGMGMTTTAEGVETEEQRDRIAAEGCTEMQGYLFSPSLPALEIERRFLSADAPAMPHRFRGGITTASPPAIPGSMLRRRSNEPVKTRWRSSKASRAGLRGWTARAARSTGPRA